MLHHSDPSQAEVSGFSQAQLDALTHSVEQRRQQLEKDIQDYIARKQDELRQYEEQVRRPFLDLGASLRFPFHRLQRIDKLILA